MLRIVPIVVDVGDITYYSVKGNRHQVLRGQFNVSLVEE